MSGKEHSPVPVEFYAGSRVLSGYLFLAGGRRLLDILNRLGHLDRDVQSDYVEFTADASPIGVGSPEARYVRKASVEMAALSDPDLARGAGATGTPEVFPRVAKAEVRVSIELPGHSLDGTMHCSPGRTIRDALDENILFLPITEVTILKDNRIYASRAFVAVRKDLIISVAQQKPACALR